MNENIDKLICGLASAGWKARQDAKAALVKIGSPAVEPLVTFIKDASAGESARIEAINALKQIDDLRAVELLTSVMNSCEGPVRWAAVKALAELGDPHAIAAAEDLLKSEDFRIFHALEGFAGRILIAEDERDMRDLISFALRFAGFSVVLTSNGAEAFEKAREVHPDLVLLDVRMPKMTGYEACKLLLDDPATKDVPVVFLSAKGQEGEIEMGFACGAIEYIIKPFAPGELTKQIKDIFRRLRLGIY